MPYYIYKIIETPFRRLEKLEQHDAFRPASERAKQMRGELEQKHASCIIKVMFAENELQAEDLLSQVREAQPNPQDD